MSTSPREPTDPRSSRSRPRPKLLPPSERKRRQTGGAAHRSSNEYDYFTESALPAIESCFGIEARDLNNFFPSPLQNKKHWRDTFTISRRTGRVIVYHCEWTGGRRGAAFPLDLDIAYGMYHGYSRDEMMASIAMRFMYRRRLLHDAGLRVVRRTPFRRPLDVFRDLLCPDGKYLAWLDHLALLDGLGLAIDLHDDITEPVPFSLGFAAHWCYHVMKFTHPDWTRKALRNKDDAFGVQKKVGYLRKNLVKAGLVHFVGKGHNTRYKLGPLGDGEQGVDYEALRRLYVPSS